MRYMVFIPAYYAESTLEGVVRRIPKQVYDTTAEILIQDDASTDQTFEIAQRLAAEFKKVTAIRNDVNLGYGGTQKKAYRYALEKDYESVVMVHGDGQLPPEVLMSVLSPLLNCTADIVLGSRILGNPLSGGMPLYKWAGNRFLTLILNWRLGEHLTDYHTGYVAYSRNALQQFDYATCYDGHEISSQILIRASRKRLRIEEVAVPTHYDEHSRSVTWQTSVKYGFQTLRMLFWDRNP